MGYNKSSCIRLPKINLLAKEKIEDSMMRIQSKEIASELMELTFGK